MSHRPCRLLTACFVLAAAPSNGTAQCIVDQWAGPQPTSEERLGLVMAADGEWLAVSSGANIAPGRVHLLRRQADGEYAWQQSLYSPNPLSDLDFGGKLDIRGDLLAVAAPSYNHLHPPTGTVYLYQLIDGEWTYVDRFTPPTEPNNSFYGQSVHLGPDGLAVGAYAETIFLPPPGPAFALSAGAVYLYRETEAGWIPDGKLWNIDPQNLDSFGRQVRLSRTSSGVDQLLVGVPEEDDFGNNAGAVRVYERQGPSQWVPVQTLEPTSTASSSNFGEGLVVDGDRLIVASPEGGLGAQQNGLFDEYLRTGSTWVHSQSFEPTQDLTSSNFTSGLDLLGDQFVVGTATWLGDPQNPGFVTRFERSGGAWIEASTTSPKFPQTSQSFGVSVALLDTEPSRLAVGAANDSTFGEGHGLVSRFAWEPGACQTLFSDVGLTSLSTPEPSLLRLEPPSGSEGSVYFVLGSTGGTQPGIALDGQLLPLVVDDYFLQTLTQPNSSPLPDGLGTVAGAWGTALVTFAIPPGLDAALAGTHVHHAYVLIDPLLGQVVHASNPVLNVLVP